MVTMKTVESVCVRLREVLERRAGVARFTEEDYATANDFDRARMDEHRAALAAIDGIVARIRQRMDLDARRQRRAYEVADDEERARMEDAAQSSATFRGRHLRARTCPSCSQRCAMLRFAPADAICRACSAALETRQPSLPLTKASAA